MSVCVWASLVTQLVKNPCAMQETLVGFLGGEDTYSGILGLPGDSDSRESACNA